MKTTSASRTGSCDDSLKDSLLFFSIFFRSEPEVVIIKTYITQNRWYIRQFYLSKKNHSSLLLNTNSATASICQTLLLADLVTRRRVAKFFSIYFTEYNAKQMSLQICCIPWNGFTARTDTRWNLFLVKLFCFESLAYLYLVKTFTPQKAHQIFSRVVPIVLLRIASIKNGRFINTPCRSQVIAAEIYRQLFAIIGTCNSQNKWYDMHSRETLL